MAVSYPTPLSHAEDILSTFTVDAKAKYLAGQAEHGGRLWRKPVLPMLYQEVLDLPIYLLTHMGQMARVRELVWSAFLESGTTASEKALLRVVNLLDYGNEEGVAEEDR